ncbi:MAG: DUF3465 domain-containing protein [Bdellovibrio sp.]
MKKISTIFVSGLILLFAKSSLALGEQYSSSQIADDSDIVRAVNDQRRIRYVEGGGMLVVKILPDDNSGLKHQKWIVRLSNGINVEAVYNSDMCPRIPVRIGDVVAMGGEFIWTKSGALIHWLHGDPKKKRQDGFVYLNGNYYCKNVSEVF